MGMIISRRIVHAIPLAFAAAMLGSGSQAGVDISTKPTQNMSCASGVCSPTAKKAVLNVNDVTTALAAGDLKVTTGSGAEDIHIDAPFSWTSVSRLTLDAQRSITIEKAVVVAGPGGLTLTTNDGGTGGDYWFDAGASVTFWDLNGRLIINGQSFTLVKDIKTLASAIVANSSGFFALSNNYDASVDGTYKQAPIGRIFYGTFEGLGNTVANLTIMAKKKLNIGLFSQIGRGSPVPATLRDIVLINAVVISKLSRPYVNIGALLGLNYGGTVTNSYASSTVSASGPYAQAGGLVGKNWSYSTITKSGASSQVAVGYEGRGGGLVGDNENIVAASFSHGRVTSGDVLYAMVGGLAGGGGDVDASFSDADVVVQHDACAGGLVGFAYTVSNSHAIGSVSGTYSAGVGGLACSADKVTNSYATGAVTAGDNSSAGGLLANGTREIDSCFATGNVSAGANASVGGLVGRLLANNLQQWDGATGRSYSLGAVSGGSGAFVGGLVGYKEYSKKHHRQYYTTITQSYSVGPVSGAGATLGGSVGFDPTPDGLPNHIDAAYWDLDTSGIGNRNQGAGNVPNDSGITGLSDTQLKSALPAGFDPTIWGQRFKINNGYPYLLANPPPK
jgi:hypothetical protein